MASVRQALRTRCVVAALALLTLLFALRHQIEGGVVVVFGFLAGVVGHEPKILTGLN